MGICVEDHQTTTQGGYPSISNNARFKVILDQDLWLILAPFGSEGKDGGEALGQERLTSARRTGHQDIVIAGRGDQESALGVILSLDVDEVIFGLCERLAEDLFEIDGLRVPVAPGPRYCLQVDKTINQ